MTKSLSVFVRDNLEAFAVAIALALVVRHYSLEAFRIPSNSMMPTLYGSEVSGDRILVDKFLYLRSDPERWMPTVFQYPLNRTKNFIKRLVGLPGERLRIEDGDIRTSRDGGATWRVERKPKDVQDTLFFPYYPEPIEERGALRNRRNFEGLGWGVDERARRFEVDASEKVALRFVPDVVQYHSEGLAGDARLPEYKAGWSAAGDLRVRFRVEVERPGTLVVELTEHALARRLVLAAEGSRVVIAHSDGTEETYPVDVRLGKGEHEISFANVDDTLLVEVDGDTVLEQPFRSDGDAAWRGETAKRVEEALDEANRLERDSDPEGAARLRQEVDAPRKRLAAGRHRVVFEAESIKAELSDVAIDRDVHYVPDGLGEWQIPDGHYFMLGDNTNRSKDSRKWVVAEVTLKDGTVIRWEEANDLNPGDVPGQPNADFTIDGPDELIEVKADVDGLVRRFHTRDVLKRERDVHWGFVSKDHLVGRAFAIFWPIHVWPVFKSPTRIGLIR